MMLKAVHFGAGNIGRGFIGSLLYKSGYEVLFVDISKELVDNINKYGKYNIFVLGNNILKEEVKNVRAINISDDEDLSDAIYNADIITTSVGVNNLQSIGKLLAKHLKRRVKNSKSLNIMACENALFATNKLKDSVLDNVDTEVLNYINSNVGFPNTAVDRIVPNVDIKKESPIDVAVENFFEWDIEKNAIKGNIDIDGAELVDNLEPFIERKLFLLNGAHATTAYLGYLMGFKYIHEAIRDKTIEKIVVELQKEASKGLNSKHNIPLESLSEYSNKVIERFKNNYLKDEVVRVGRDPIRKLSNNDRLVSPAKLCLKLGVIPYNLAYGIAAGFAFDYQNDKSAVEIQDDIKKMGIRKTVIKVTSLEEDSSFINEIVNKYEELIKKYRG